MQGQLIGHSKIRNFVLSGNAYFTIVNPDKGTRYTYRVSQKENPDGSKSPHFVGVLSGSDNVHHYRYLGVIFDGKNYRRTSKSKIGVNAPSALAFNWLWKVLNIESPAINRIEFWHEGRCGRCGRKLTVPESIETGIGPVCAGRA